MFFVCILQLQMLEGVPPTTTCLGLSRVAGEVQLSNADVLQDPFPSGMMPTISMDMFNSYVSLPEGKNNNQSWG